MREGWNYFVVFNSSHSSMGCLANQRRLCPSWKWREPEPEPSKEWLELFCWLLGVAVNNLIPAIPSWKWRETDYNIPLFFLNKNIFLTTIFLDHNFAFDPISFWQKNFLTEFFFHTEIFLDQNFGRLLSLILNLFKPMGQISDLQLTSFR